MQDPAAIMKILRDARESHVNGAALAGLNGWTRGVELNNFAVGAIDNIITKMARELGEEVEEYGDGDD